MVRGYLSVVLLAVFCSGLFWRPAEGGGVEAVEKRKRGEFIFFSNRVFEPGPGREEERAYLRRFRVCLTNGYENFTGREREALQEAGCQLFLYLWFNGFYERELAETGGPESAYIRRFPAMQAMFRAIRAHPEWLLNPGRPLQGGGAVYPALFYDYGHPAFRAFYIRSIRDQLKRTGYRGVFFDYIGGWALPEEAAALWRARHPEETYDEAGVRFLRELRRAIPGVRLFGNQAYRLAADYYACIDYDLSESHATSFLWGPEARIYVQGKGMQAARETFYRLWDGPNGYKAISQPRREASARRPRVRVFDLNYLQPRYVPAGRQETVDGEKVPVFIEETDRPAIFYGWALAKITGIEAYASDWYAPGFGRDDIYSLDMGRPTEPTFREERDVVVRYYERGFVAVTRRGERAVLAPDAGRLPAGVTGLWDVYARRRVPDWPARRDIEIPPTLYPASQSLQPAGRVYLYVYGGRQASGGERE